MQSMLAGHTVIEAVSHEDPPVDDLRSLPRPQVSVVMPALNEAQNLPAVLASLPRDLHEVILVDGCSTDGTAELARRLRPDIRVVQQPGRGKGNALACGFETATGDIIVMFDADGSARGSEIPLFVSTLVGGADFAKGTRFVEGGGTADMTFIRRLGNWVLCRLVNVLHNSSYTDLCYGYNAFWRKHLDKLQVDCDGFEVETQLGVRAWITGLRVVEVPSYEDPRMHGASNLHPVRDGWRVLMTILRERFRRPREVAIPLDSASSAQTVNGVLATAPEILRFSE
jgi:glycosyltransferase involved in cell wall biosynthesis